MISRRLLRIKALLALYAFNRRDDADLVHAEKELLFSIGKTYDLYHYIFLLILEIADIASEKIDIALQKKTQDDLNPNRRFVQNQVISQLRQNQALRSYQTSKRISWSNYQEIPRTLYGKMISWSPYEEYMKANNSSYVDDKKLIIKLVTEFFPVSDPRQ